VFRKKIKSSWLFKRVSKTPAYARLRAAWGPQAHSDWVDDSDTLGNGVAPVVIDWPAEIRKPKVGVIRDHGPSPRWTKYIRFLDHNKIPYSIYEVHRSRWLQEARQYDVVVGICSSAAYRLDEMRRKYNVLERHMGIACYPGFDAMLFYEDKILEAHLSTVYDLPFVPTFVSNDYQDTVDFIANAELPLVSKIVPGAGSVGVELMRTRGECLKVARRAFSSTGRASHVPYMRQKDYVYFQQFIENDGYDLRVIVVENMVFGYYRKVLANDFRASGMNEVEKRELPPEAMRIALKAYGVFRMPMLVVDMLRDSDGKFWVIEMSPNCQIETPEQLHVNGVPGAYMFSEDGSCRFEPGRFWVHELALRSFFKNYIRERLPATKAEGS